MSIVQPIGPTWPYNPAPPVYPAQGYTCGVCGIWVQYGTAHVCYGRGSTTTTLILKGQEADVDDYETKKLGEIVEAVKKARRAFDELEDETHGRIVEFLGKRFGVEQAAFFQVLMEER